MSVDKFKLIHFFRMDYGHIIDIIAYKLLYMLERNWSNAIWGSNSCPRLRRYDKKQHINIRRCLYHNSVAIKNWRARISKVLATGSVYRKTGDLNTLTRHVWPFLEQNTSSRVAHLATDTQKINGEPLYTLRLSGSIEHWLHFAVAGLKITLK